MKRNAFKLKSRATSQKLIRLALRSWESDAGWRAVMELQMRGCPETLAHARRLASEPSWRKRSLGLHIASQLRRRTSQDQSGSVEYALVETQALLLVGLYDNHEEVVRAAISGFGHRPHPDALDKLIQLSSHKNASIRFSVAVALGRYSDPSAIASQVILAGDVDSDVRDWATFGLGTLQDVDTPEVRELLWLNLNDDDCDVRGEALVGLAKRRDPRVEDYLFTHLDENSRVYELEAAEMLASPRLLEPLLKLAKTAGEMTYWHVRLNSAIAASSGASH